MSHPEKVLVVPRRRVEELLGPGSHGYVPGADDVTGALLESAVLMVRDEAEQDHGHKQVIPYTVFTCRLGEDDELVYSYERGAGGGEGRLHGLRSLGIGGHVEEGDLGALKLRPEHRREQYQRARIRELDEEVFFGGEVRLNRSEVVGYLNDDTPHPEPGQVAVGQVHLGFVHRIDLYAPRLRVREGHALTNAGWASSQLLGPLGGLFETWSRFLIDAWWPAR